MSSGDLEHSSHCKNIPLARASLECGLFMGQKMNVFLCEACHCTYIVISCSSLRKNSLLDQKYQSLILSMQRKINAVTLKPKFLVDLCKGVGKIYGHSWFAVVKPYNF